MTVRRTQIEANEEYEAAIEAREEARKLREENKGESNQDKEDEEEEIEKPVITKNDIIQDYLTSDQSFVFSDEITIY